MPPERSEGESSNQHTHPDGLLTNGRSRTVQSQTPPLIPAHEMIRCIGEGSYGEVWLARSTLGSYRAVKVVYRDRLKNEREYEREFAGIQHFEPISRTHDGFVDILQVGRSDAGDWFYYVMELADDAAIQPPEENVEFQGGVAAMAPASYSPKTLSAKLERQGRLPAVECVRVGLALTAALDHLHRCGLVHRDIKPSNIIFVNGQPKLADVGLVAETSEARSMVGTRGFIPPEGPGSVQADLYALGKVLYAASTGHGATAWPNPLTGLDEIPDQKEWLELNEVIICACEPDPKRRYTSAVGMQADLAQLQAGKSLQRQRKLEKRFKQAAWAAMGVLVLGLAGLFLQQMQVKAAKRATALLQLEKQLSPPHREGWSNLAWQKASQAAERFGFDSNLQSQAAASLAGLDAKLRFQSNNVGGSSIAFDLAGKQALFGSLTEHTIHPGKAHLLDLDSGKLRAFSVPGQGPVAFLSDGTPVEFSGDGSNRLALWLVGPGAKQQSAGIPGARDQTPNDCEVQDEPVVGAAQPTALRFFALASHEMIGGIVALAITPDGRYVAASGTNTDGRAFLAAWDGTTGRPLAMEAGVRSADLQAAGSQTTNPLADISSAESRTPISTLTESSQPGRLEDRAPQRAPLLNPATALAFTLDGSLLAAGNDGGVVTIWRVCGSSPSPAAGEETRHALPSEKGEQRPTTARVLTDTSAANRSKTLGGTLSPINAGRDAIRSLAFCRDFVHDPLRKAEQDQWLLAVGDAGAGVTIWEVPAQRLRTRCLGAQYERYALTFSPDGTMVASAGRWPVNLWDTATGIELLSLSDGDAYVGVSMSPDGKRMAVCSKRPAGGSQLIAWELENGRGIQTYRGLSRQIARVCLSADGKLLAAVAHDWQVGIWDLTTHQLLHVLNMPKGTLTADNAGLAFSPDRTKFAFLTDRQAILIDVASGTLLQDWLLPPGAVGELAFSPTGHLLAFRVESTNKAATAYSKPVVPRIRDLSARDPLNSLIELHEFNRVVHGAIWSPDGSFIVVEGVGIDSGKTTRWIEAAAPLSGRVLWKCESRMDPSWAAHFSVDASDKLVAFPLGPEYRPAQLCEATSGKLRRQIAFPPAAFDSEADLIFGRRDKRDWRLFSLTDASVRFRSHLSESASSCRPVLSRGGHLLAWGNEDGTVSVYNLPEMRQRLNALKLGW